MDVDFAKMRQEMVDWQIRRRGMTDSATLDAMQSVPREKFVPLHLIPYSYDDGPLPIDEGQTISQPYIVALMTASAELQSDDRVLDIGTGSGYAAAILSQIVHQVYSIERIPSLTEKAKKIFSELGYENIHCTVGDGSLGWEEHAPYNAIIATAGAPIIPEALVKQLTIGGRLVIPVGDQFGQQLLRIRKINEEHIEKEVIELVRFVPLIGKEGW